MDDDLSLLLPLLPPRSSLLVVLVLGSLRVSALSSFSIMVHPPIPHFHVFAIHVLSHITSFHSRAPPFHIHTHIRTRTHAHSYIFDVNVRLHAGAFRSVLSLTISQSHLLPIPPSLSISISGGYLI